MPGAADRLRETADARESVWSPGLAVRLVSDFCTAHPDRCSTAYGSWSWLAGAPATETRPLGSPDHGISIELLPHDGQRRYAPLDLKLANRLPTADECALLVRAIALLDVGAGLGEAVRALVRVIHLVEAKGLGFDCSHSDPELPFSIFVSIPLGENDAELRLAESILHEAMHLQLTLVNVESPLVRCDDVTGFSPWQRRERPLLGLVHGLFVFRAIDQWLERLGPQHPSDGSIPAYCHRRRTAIAAEIDMVRSIAGSSALTPSGAALVERLLTPGAQAALASRGPSR